MAPLYDQFVRPYLLNLRNFTYLWSIAAVNFLSGDSRLCATVLLVTIVYLARMFVLVNNIRRHSRTAGMILVNNHEFNREWYRHVARVIVMLTKLCSRILGILAAFF